MHYTWTFVAVLLPVRLCVELLQDDLTDLVSIKADQSVYDAVALLHENNVRRLLVVGPDDTAEALFVLTNKRILHFIHLMVRHRCDCSLYAPPFLNRKTVARESP
jgi:CBS domain-containing protein